jgi:hypothetical protein
MTLPNYIRDRETCTLTIDGEYTVNSIMCPFNLFKVVFRVTHAMIKSFTIESRMGSMNALPKIN